MVASVWTRRKFGPLSQSLFNEGGKLSPDGHWLAGMSDRSGSDLEIYVYPYPDVRAGRWQVSFAGGRLPLWARDGRELFFLAPGRVADGFEGSNRGCRMELGSPPVKLLEPAFWSFGRTLPAKISTCRQTARGFSWSHVLQES